ncbi:MAG: aminotransferase [Granulosicoccus sp.]|nr:aminotransferase [Granulosicoccus sp.]
MKLTLSLNTNPFVNRYAEADDLLDTIARKIRIRDIQLTHEFINPSWPMPLTLRRTHEFSRAMARTGVRVTSGMTGPYGRLNHFGHPNADVRQYYVEWFKRFADIMGELGARAIGTQFAIFTVRDFADVRRREELMNIAIDCWMQVSEHARQAGLDYLFWEPMSVGREFGETIEKALALQARFDELDSAIPLKMMADIDHGDLSSTNPDDFNPYAWARAVPTVSPIIHIKQSLIDKGGHRPFTASHNAVGRIQPERLLRELAAGSASDNEICLELSFKEREPDDRMVVPDIAESVAYWAPYIDSGVQDLNV